MDSLPNEILFSIICCLEKQEIPKMRLVSNRFNLLAMECVKKFCTVYFTPDSDIAKFVKMFENKAVVPFQRFKFSKTVLAYGQPLEQFCGRFAEIVKYWKICEDAGDLEALGDNSVSKNWEILLENCVNVEKIVYYVVKDKNEIGKFTKIPTLQNLKTVTITEFDSENTNLVPILHQIFEKAPNIRGVSIKNLKVQGGSHHETVPHIFNQLYNLNGTVHIQKLCMNLWLPMTNVGDLERLFPTSTEFTIVDLELSLYVEDPHPDQLPQTVEILSKWIQNLTSVRKFSLTYFDKVPGDEHVPIVIPAHSLSNLECLEFCCEFPIHIAVAPGQPTEFPVLTSLMCKMYPVICSGCVFPNVKFAQIDLETEEDCEQWPRVIPNVEELLVYVGSETLKGIFRFPRLRKLNITMHFGSNSDDDDDEVRGYWNHLTGGAAYVADSSICTFPVTTPYTSDSIDSFRNLPRKVSYPL